MKHIQMLVMVGSAAAALSHQVPREPPHHEGLQARHEEQQVEASLVAYTVGLHRASAALHLPPQRAELTSKKKKLTSAMFLWNKRLRLCLCEESNHKVNIVSLSTEHHIKSTQLLRYSIMAGQ